MTLTSLQSFIARHWLQIILAAVVVTRLPFLLTGYGADSDAWLVADSATALWKDGTYLPSRLPGNPLHEILSAPFVALGGAPFSNGATLIATLVAVILWDRIAARAGTNRKLLVLAFAFAPVIWQHSAVTLDYMWSLLFLLLAARSVLRNNVIAAGIMLGVAAGFRLPNIIAAVPLIVLISLKRHGAGNLIRFVVAASVVTMAAYLPLINMYGIPGWFIATGEEMSDMHFPFIERAGAFVYRSIYFIGPLGACMVCYIFWKARREIRDSVRTGDHVTVVALAGIMTFLALFFWLPVERAYLLPALPLLLLLVNRYSTEKMFALFTALVLLSGLLNIDVVNAGDRRTLDLNIHRGMVLEELKNRREFLRVRREIASLSLPAKSVVMTSSGPALWLDNELLEPVTDTDINFLIPSARGHYILTREKMNAQIIFAAYLGKEELDAVRRAGYDVYCLSSARKYVESVVGYSVMAMNIPLIPP